LFGCSCCRVHLALVDDQCHEVRCVCHHPPASRPSGRSGCRTPPPAATPDRGSGSSWPTSAWPTGWPAGSARAAGPRPRICLGRSPTSSELAEHLEVGEEEVLEALAAAGSRREVSLDQPVGNELDGSLGDLVAAPAAREGQRISWPCRAWWPPCRSWSARSSCSGSSRSWTSMRSQPGSATPAGRRDLGPPSPTARYQPAERG
jgi:hypothetical protein